MSLRKRAAAEAAAAKKGRYFQGLKNGHADQLNKLQTKHQYECDLLDDLRNFSKSRAALEKTFAEGLQKLTTSYLSKKLPPVPELVGSSSDSKSSWNAWSVWISVLEENEAIAKARLAAVEEFQARIFEDARLVRQAKGAGGKKNLDHLSLIHKELQASAQDLDKAKRTYFEEEHLAYEARTKANDADERLKRKKGHFFQSLSSLQKNSAKFTAKKDACDERATLARNQYLLQLAASNAQQKRFYNVDLPSVMKALECDVYEKMKEYLTFYTDTELRTCQAMQAAFTEIQSQAKSMTRDYNFACFVTWFPGIAPSITYDFEPCDGDSITRISDEFGCAEFLDQEATKWSIRLAKELKTTKEYNKKIQSLQNPSEKKEGSEAEVADPDAKLEELKEFLRIAETAKEKAEARLETLREGGMNIDEYLKKAFTDMETLDPSDLMRSQSQTSLPSDMEPAADSSFYDDDEHQQSYEQQRSMSESEHGDEPTPPAASQKTMQYPVGDPLAMEWGDDEEEQFPPPPTETNEVVVNGGTPAAPGIKCIAVYAYSAQNADELTIVENEQLEVVGEGDGEGWVLARNYRGEEGFVPKNYVEAEGAEEGEQGGGGSSFSSVDYTVDAVKDDNANDLDTSTTGMVNGSGPMINRVRVAQDDGDYCCAIYDYEATCKEELTFIEGAVIKILRRQVHEVDDGWWEGEFEGQVGLFPSIVVEDCRPNGEPFEMFDEEDEEDEEEEEEEPDLPTPAGPPPPMLTPPELPGLLLPPEGIIITQPTPDVEHPPSAFGEEPPPPLEEEEVAGDAEAEKEQPEAEADKQKESTTKAKGKEPSMPVSYSAIVEGFELKMNEDQRRLYQERQQVEGVSGEEGEEGAEADGSGSSVGPDSVEECEVASVVRCEAHEFAGGLQIASIVVTAATPVAPAPEEDFFAAPSPPPLEEESSEEPPPMPPAPEDEEEPAVKSDESVDDTASVDSVQQKQEQPVKVHEDVQIVIDPPNEPAREDQFEGIDVMQEIPEVQEEPHTPEPVIVKVEEPTDGGSGIVDCKKAFPPPKMIDDSLEEEEEKKLPEELQPEQLRKLEHIQESNA